MKQRDHRAADPQEGYGVELWATSRLVLCDEPLLEITYDSLHDEVYRLDLRRALKGIDRPLAFLNLCNGDFHPLSSQSISELLIRNGNRGVISTSIRVPDDVAGLFAEFFYDSLLYTPGITAGRALHEARIKLMERMANPLGMLYTYSGDPDLVVAPTLVQLSSQSMPL